MPKVGNDLWWDQVKDVHTQLGQVHYRQAELVLFVKLYTRMKEGGYSQQEIRDHFCNTFNIKYGAFYARLRKACELNVLR